MPVTKATTTKQSSSIFKFEMFQFTLLEFILFFTLIRLKESISLHGKFYHGKCKGKIYQARASLLQWFVFQERIE